MFKHSWNFALTATLLSLAAAIPSAESSVVKHPKLILTIVLDQFRADYLTRFENRFEAGGFRYLMTHGAYYPYGQYDITQSMTGPGHATILTGAYPYQNGIPSNYWYDRERGEKTYCTDDVKFGSSPRNMNGTTVGDELKNAGYPSRVVSIALKDRAAILMGGHRADLALWFDSKKHRWNSSRYYLPDGKVPDWVDSLNREVQKDVGQVYVWTPHGKSSVLPDEIHGSSAFVHAMKKGDYESYSTPYGVDLTVQACERAIEAYHLGRGPSTDLFAVSFSSHDYAGHEHGPNSREMEEMTLSEDHAIAQLLDFVKARIPLQEVVIVLTGDHGIPPEPDWLVANRTDAGRIKDAELASAVEAAMNDRFGKPGQPWLGFFHDFNLYFNPAALKKESVSLAKADEVGKEALLKIKGVAYVLTSSDLEAGKLPPGMHGRQAMKTFYPGRSGDLTIIPKPLYTKDEDTVDHITGYNYDRTVPIILSGLEIRPGVRAEKTEVIDIAPTLTFLAGTIPPDLSEGRVLSEALDLTASHVGAGAPAKGGAR